MAILRLRSEPSFATRKSRWQAPLAGLISFLILLVCVFLIRRVDAARASLLTREPLFLVAVAALVVAIFSAFMYFNRSKIERTRHQIEYEITDAGLSRHYPALPDLFVPASDITGFELRKKSIIVRLKENPKAMTLSSDLIGFEQLAVMFGEMGIPEIPPQKYRLYLSFLKVIVCAVGIFLCVEVLFGSRDPLHVAIAGICYVAALGLLSIRQNRSPYQMTSTKKQRLNSLLTLAVWALLVVFRVWTVSHPHAHGHLSLGRSHSQPAQQFSPRS
jgi:hypothetical protein